MLEGEPETLITSLVASAGPVAVTLGWSSIRVTLQAIARRFWESDTARSCIWKQVGPGTGRLHDRPLSVCLNDDGCFAGFVHIRTCDACIGDRVVLWC